MTRVSKTFLISYVNTCQDLQACLDEISNPSPASTTERFVLDIYRTNLSPSILTRLVQVLNHPLSKAGAGTDTKWDKVHFYGTCRIVRPGVIPWGAENEGFCSEDDIQIFASSLASRAWSVAVCGSHDIFERLLNTPHLALERLHLAEMDLSTLKCARFADLVQRCVSLNELIIQRSHFAEPNFLAKVLLDAPNLERICFKRVDTSRRRQKILSDILFCRDNGNCIVSQLLNPPRRLQSLTLQNMYLNDFHFLSIVEMLPTSQLQVLDVSRNDIGHKGILAFASQLPRIKFLEEVRLHYNSWCHLDPFNVPKSAKYKTRMAALLRGMIENYSLEFLDVPQSDCYDQLEYCTTANWERRVILAKANSVPVGLWPLILEKVGNRKWNPKWEEELRFRNYRANALYFVMRNCPILSISLAAKSCRVAQTYPSRKRSL